MYVKERRRRESDYNGQYLWLEPINMWRNSQYVWVLWINIDKTFKKKIKDYCELMSTIEASTRITFDMYVDNKFTWIKGRCLQEFFLNCDFFGGSYQNYIFLAEFGGGEE